MFTKFIGGKRLIAAAAVGLVLAGWCVMNVGSATAQEPPKPKDVVDVAKATENCKMFCTLCDKAGLVETLKGEGPYTVLVPTDDAFNKLGKEKLDDLQKPENKAKLQKLLKHHVVAGKFSMADLKTKDSLTTLAGDKVTVSVKEGIVMIDKAKVTKGDTQAANGVLHQLDAVNMAAE